MYPEFSENAMTVLKKRYLKPTLGDGHESPDEMFMRVAESVAAAEKDEITVEEQRKLADSFFKMMRSLDFLPNSPTLMNAGRELGQLSGCYVLPVDDSMEEIFEAVKLTAMVHKTGGGTGFSFSRLRPSGDKVKTTNGVSSGPITFMEVFNAATEAVKQGGTRRGANMGCLSVHHPDIESFITCKADTSKITNFNISVLATRSFMDAVLSDDAYPLINPRTNEVAKMIQARPIFDMIVKMAHQNGEPGIIFIDRINECNPTPKIGMIESTNPCGEQPLLPYESCNLGSINLENMVEVTKTGMLVINWPKLKKTVTLAVRFLDDVIDINRYPLDRIAELTRANRKIGLGVMGFANMLIALNIPYDSDTAAKLAEEVMSVIQKIGHDASSEIAERRGNFPNFQGSTWEYDSGYAGMRNAAVTTIAPTGSISCIASCSSGIEPNFGLVFKKHILDGETLFEVNKAFEALAIRNDFWGYTEEELYDMVECFGSIQGIIGIDEAIKDIFKTSLDIAPIDHLRIQTAFQRFTDNAVSKTVNLRNEATVDDVKDIYLKAYEMGCKGVTVYRYGSRDNQVLTIKGASGKTEEQLQDVQQSLTTIVGPRERPDVTDGSTERITTGCGRMYVTINEDKDGICEVFAYMGKAGGCAFAQLESIGRLASLSFRAGVSAKEITKHLRGIRCPSIGWEKGGEVLSCADAIGIAVERYLARKDGKEVEVHKLKDSLVNMVGACPECGRAISHESGCLACVCGWSRC